MDWLINIVSGFAGPVYTQYVVSAILIALSFMIANIASYIITLIERHITSRSKISLDDKILEAVKGPLKVGIVIIGIVMALEYMSILDAYVNEIRMIYTILVPLFIGYLASRIAGGLIDWYTTEVASKTNSKVDDQLLPIVKKLIYALIFGVLILIVFNQLGVKVETAIAALGIGGLAVALALQPTLTNFFSGAQMVADRPIRIGDYIEIESLEKGVVMDIGWRSTKIRTFTNNIVVLPNSKIADSKIINYSIPDPTAGFTVDCGVAYDSDLEKVEKVALEVAKETLNEYNGVKDFEPVFRFREFGSSSINFRVIMRTKTLGDTYFATHGFIKNIKKRFDREGIEIAFPQMDVHFDSSAPKHVKAARKPRKK
ncbi:MAG: mechanosensitive ion channel family protein [Candidatus Aenigmarchaeota archaeon]|nr:mechanosensitive ion channel family protein [Candidatus Aenigmarchaeota archaeon]